MTSDSNVLSARDRVLSIPELIDHIVQFLRQVHLSQLRLTCKTFKCAFTPHVSFEVSQDYYKNRKPELQALAVYGPLVKSLRIDALGNESNLETMLEHHQAILRVNFRCWGSNDGLFYKILETQSLLKDLTLNLSGDSVKAYITGLVETIASRAPPLESLSLYTQVRGGIIIPWTNICFILDACPKIQHLSFRGFNILRNNDKVLPQIQSLVVSDAYFNHNDIGFFLHTMPNLRSLNLHLYKSAENVFNVIMGEHIYPTKNILPQLTKLKIGARRSHLPGLAQFIQHCCPCIQDLELVDECGLVRRLDMLRLLDHFNHKGITLKRFAFDYYPESSIEDWVRRVLESCCPKLEELQLGGGIYFLLETQDYLYKWKKSGESSMRDHFSEGLKFWFPFASTLTKLHLNNKTRMNAIPYHGPYLVNLMIQSMPLLEDLALMNMFEDYSVLQGLGRCPASNKKDKSLHSPDQAEEKTAWLESQNFPQERPFLRFLGIGLAKGVGFKATVWDREMVDRFRFLEQLSVKTALSHPQMEELSQWQETLRPGLEFTLLPLGE
ncbi:hypothetical protein BGX27_009633 [Mortierella sp. AM989]|nr:hypothetical protein BGX27_009633 [Mortierella sp. AM989]